MRLVVINHVTLDGVMQAPGRPDEDTRGGFSHGGWANPGNDEVMGHALRLDEPRDQTRLAELDSRARRHPRRSGGSQAELGRRPRDHGQRPVDPLAPAPRGGASGQRDQAA
jgi:hypothetical protein